MTSSTKVNQWAEEMARVQDLAWKYGNEELNIIISKLIREMDAAIDYAEIEAEQSV